MAEQIANRLEGEPLAQEMQGVGMTQAMDAGGRELQAAAFIPGFKRIVDGRGFERAHGGPDTQKELARRDLRAAIPQVVQHGRSGRIG